MAPVSSESSPSEDSLIFLKFSFYTRHRNDTLRQNSCPDDEGKEGPWPSDTRLGYVSIRKDSVGEEVPGRRVSKRRDPVREETQLGFRLLPGS